MQHAVDIDLGSPIRLDERRSVQLVDDTGAAELRPCPEIVALINRNGLALSVKKDIALGHG